MIDVKKLRVVWISTGKKRRKLYTYGHHSQVLRKRHLAYLSFLNKHFVPSTFCHAYTRRRSIYTCALPHLHNDIFIKLDVRNFFNSINHTLLARQVFFELNKLKDNTISLAECEKLINDCAVDRAGLPLGLMTSPLLSNIYLKQFDGIFYGNLKKMNLDNVVYTRYADDIFVSFKSGGSLNVVPREIISMCQKDLARFKLKVNSQKIKVVDMNVSNHVKIAGVNIAYQKQGRSITVGRKQIKQLYFDALSVHNSENRDAYQILRVKGLHSFFMSIYKRGYSGILSYRMNKIIKDLGYSSLEHLISSLKSSR